MAKSMIIPPVSEDTVPQQIEAYSSSSSSDDSSSEEDSLSNSFSSGSFRALAKNERTQSGAVKVRDKRERHTAVKSGGEQEELDVEDPPTRDTGTDKNGAAVAPSRRDRLFAFLNTPAFLIGSSVLFLIIVTVVITSRNKGGSSTPAQAVEDPFNPVFIIETTVPTFSPIGTPEEPTLVTVEAPADEPSEEKKLEGNWTEQLKIFFERSGPNTNFGTAVALDGGTLVAATGVGEAFVFVEDGDEWMFDGALFPTEFQRNSGFGSCIAINGGIALVGAAAYDNGEDNQDVGIVYVFNRDADGSWELNTTIQAQDGKSGDRFGSSCALSDKRMVIGAPFVDKGEQQDVGAAYAYTLEEGQWTLDMVLSPADDSTCTGESLAEYRFGTHVAVLGNRIVAGPAPEQTCRRVHIFDYSGGSWSQEFEVGEDGGCPYSVSLNDGGNSLAIGDSCGWGDVLLYTRSGDKAWDAEAQITDRRARKEDRFGASVALDGDNLLIGRPGNGMAEMYIREEGGWSDRDFVLEAGDDTGDHIALSGTVAVLGNPFDDEAGENTGAVHVFRYVEFSIPTEDSSLASEQGREGGEAAYEEPADEENPTEEAPVAEDPANLIRSRVRGRRRKW